MSDSDSTGAGAGGGTEADTGAGAGEGAGVLPQQAREIADGYAVGGAALDLGALVWDGTCLPCAQIRIPLGMLNRHGLVAGATGTGCSTRCARSRRTMRRRCGRR